MPQPDPRSRITVEDLLRLKRAERPSPEFWSKFEVELRQKQLAALVERHPWWYRLPQLFARRAYVPIGAAAVLTFTLVSVRTYAPSAFVVTEPAIADDVVAAAPSAPVTQSISASLARESEQLLAAATEEVDVVEPSAPVRLSDRLPDQARDLLPWSAQRSVDSPSARSIAANLARLEQTEPELVNSLLPSSSRAGSRSVQESAVHVAELAAISAVASRSNRVLAQLNDRQFSPDPSAPEVVRERLSRRLGDTELTGGWNRVGVKADRVSLKF